MNCAVTTGLSIAAGPPVSNWTVVREYECGPAVTGKTHWSDPEADEAPVPVPRVWTIMGESVPAPASCKRASTRHLLQSELEKASSAVNVASTLTNPWIGAVIVTVASVEVAFKPKRLSFEALPTRLR